LGVGSSTLLFSVIDTVLLRPLPYAEPDRLVSLFENNTAQKNDRYEVSYANFLDWRSSSRSFETMGACAQTTVRMTGSAEPQRVAAALASSDLFRLLGAAPLSGRLFQPADDRPGAERVALISERLWRGAMGSDPSAVGRTLTLDGEAWTVAGIVPDALRFPDAATMIWLPMGAFRRESFMTNRALHIRSGLAPPPPPGPRAPA